MNFVLKLYFEESHRRKRQKHQEGREHYLSCVHIYMCYCACAGRSALLSTANIPLWHANSGCYPETNIPAEWVRLRRIYECCQLQHYSHTPQWLEKGKFYYIFISNYLVADILVIDCDILCIRYHERLLYDAELWTERWRIWETIRYRKLLLFKNIHFLGIKNQIYWNKI